MRNFTQLAVGMDFVPLHIALLRQPQLWTMDTFWKEKEGSYFQDVDTIYLRFPDKDGSGDPMEAFDQPAFDFLPEARPIIFAIMARVQGERLGRVLVNRLPSGKRVIAHSDRVEGMTDKYYDRFHAVIQTNAGVDFRAGDEHAAMRPGDIWWFDNFAEHEVKNGGNSDRIHMIVDIRTRHKNG